MGDAAETSFGERVRDARNKRGLSQVVLAERVGMSQVWVSDVERGRTTSIDPNVIVRLAEVLRVSPLALLGVEHASWERSRLGELEAYASDLTDSDIAALTSVARQIASRPQPIALPAELDDVEGIEDLTEGERRAVLRAIELRDKADRMGGRREDQAAGGRDVGAGRKPRRQRSRQVD